MFEGFEEFDIPVSGTTIHGRFGGSGPPLLLLHGIPETHLMWHRVAPALAEQFTVVVTDLRGYGDSGAPPSTDDHSAYAMRALAVDQVEVMARLGHRRFAVAGHDRGGRCAYRLAIDHPDAVSALTVLDIVPTAEAFRRADRDFSLGYWVWSFLAAPYPVPERLVANAPVTLVDHMLDAWSGRTGVFPPELRAAYLRTFTAPASVHAICEQYRAAATSDVAHDEHDRGRHRLECPVLTLWSRGGPVDTWYEPVSVWRQWADDVRGWALDCGHFLPEEAPAEVVAALSDFCHQATTG